MSARMRVAVVGGGESCEHDVSLASAAGAVAALQDDVTVVPVTIGRDGIWRRGGAPLGASRAGSVAAAVELLAACDVVLPLVHGPGGEDGTLAALCSLAGVPVAGSPIRAGAIGMDKAATKALAASIGLRVAASVLTRVPDARAPFLPAVVKPVAAGSSHGVRLAATADAVRDAVVAALELDDAVLIEEVVTGREIDVAVLQRADGSRLVGPPLEIELGDAGIFDTAGKYDGTARFVVPAALPPEVVERLAAAALALFDALGCSGVARFDFFLTSDGLVLNEVNTTPGMTAQSQVPRMFGEVGLGYRELLLELIEAAVA